MLSFIAKPEYETKFLGQSHHIHKAFGFTQVLLAPCQRAALASATARAVMLMMRRTVADGVRM